MGMVAGARLVLFPGMGVDARMYAGLRRRGLRFAVPNWLDPQSGDDLDRYARRYVAAGLVRDGDVVGGSSFGGMLAQCIATHLRASALVLIGTCRSAAALPPLARRLAPWASRLPLGLFSSPAAIGRLALTLGITRTDQVRLVLAMMSAVDPRQLRWMCTAAGTWPGAGIPTCPVHQIHGRRDRVIPASGAGAQVLIPAAGHAIALTHPAEVAAWLRSLPLLTAAVESP
jgi:pimeloyl-ACP methyl ester carboxylesterase